MENSDFEDLFSAHSLAVYKYVARRHQGNDIEDLVAEVFTLAWRKMSEIPADFQLQWLYRTAWLVLANQHRRKGDILLGDVGVNFESELELESDVADVVISNLELREAWLKLPERDREVLRLVAWEGMSPGDVAAVLGLSIGGASSAISRARKNLEKEFSASIDLN